MSDALWILTGAPGTGKTAILDELRAVIRCVDEPARRVLARQRAGGGIGTPEGDPSRFVELLLEMAVAEYDGALREAVPTLFDRGIPDCIAYAIHLEVNPGPSIQAAQRHRYRRGVFLLEPWEDIYVTDEERTIDFAQTVGFHSSLVDAYERAGYQLIPVPRRTPQDRAAFVRSHIGELGG